LKVVKADTAAALRIGSDLLDALAIEYQNQNSASGAKSSRMPSILNGVRKDGGVTFGTERLRTR
jgi:hypothetical protein